jgi:aspartate/methionine/tyrosine aminotransferase
MSSRVIPVFEYMRWAKSRVGGVRHHIGASGLGPPEPALFDARAATDGVDLAQRSADMPEAPRRRMAARFGVAPERLALTLGTSHAMYLLAASVVGPGDLVLAESPTYELLHRLPAVHGARVERFERPSARSFRFDHGLCGRVERDRPALVLLSNPHNPSGAFLSLDELRPLSEAVAAGGGLLAIDEVYLEFLDDPPACSGHQLGDHVAVASSFTKAYGLGMARFGWLVAAPERIRAALHYNDYVSVIYPHPCADVGMAALDQLDALRGRAAAIRARNLPLVEDWLASRDDVGCSPGGASESGIVAFPRLDRVADTRTFAERLLAERGTLVVPGEFFEAPGHVRIGFGCETETLEAGLAELDAALDAL